MLIHVPGMYTNGITSILSPGMNEAGGSLIYSFLDQLDPADFIRLSRSAIFQCNEGFCQPTSWNALITLVQLPREPV